MVKFPKLQPQVRELLNTDWKKYLSFLDLQKFNDSTFCFLSNRAFFLAAQSHAVSQL